jgi:hypothetical protein
VAFPYEPPDNNRQKYGVEASESRANDYLLDQFRKLAPEPPDYTMGGRILHETYGLYSGPEICFQVRAIAGMSHQSSWITAFAQKLEILQRKERLATKD